MALIQNAAGTNTADVNSDSELAVALTKTIADAGYAMVAGGLSEEVTAPRHSAGVSAGKRLLAAIANVVFEDVFNHTINNSRKYLQATTTMTIALASGFMTLNAGNSVATTVGAFIRTWQSFPVFNATPTYINFSFALPFVPQAQNEIYIGLGLPNTAVTAPLDGVYILIDSAGALQLVANYNGSSTTSGAITFSWTANKVYDVKIVIDRNRIELYIDDVYYATVLRSAANTVGAMIMAQESYLFAQIRNVAGTTSAQQVKIANWAVQIGDLPLNKSWVDTKTLMLDTTLSTPDGVAVAMLANITNSAAPASATLSNTAAGYTTLGGNFQFAAVAGAETDYALFAYQIPVNAVGASGKRLVITGITIETWNTVVAVATTATLFNWYLGIGASAVSLATADAATTKAAHRIALGTQTLLVAAAVGAKADRIVEDFSDMKLAVNPGEFVHVILRMPVGTATATEIFRGTVSVKGYFE